ncbi:hypothetical protein IEO21_09551 [Rhodonia placenta]|uniref:Uncharacterized protein n=1 Tax=Rhodonia placenta TaxID=104341 RepID=A0A8H7TXM4_9APHY|nr:hypothetical protein IEO21_09551 [Postia placenta]
MSTHLHCPSVSDVSSSLSSSPLPWLSGVVVASNDRCARVVRRFAYSSTACLLIIVPSSVLFVTVAVSVDATPENVLTRTLSGCVGCLAHFDHKCSTTNQNLGPWSPLQMSPSKDREGVDNAPAKVSPSNDRDGVNGPLQKIKLAPAKVFPSNDRDGVKGLPQECRPPKIGMERRLNRALQICSFQADGTKAPRHGAGLCVALGISTRFNARDGETNVRPHPVSLS